MNAALLAKMMDGKRRADEARRHETTQRRQSYYVWVREESRAFEARSLAERDHGRDSEQFAHANERWFDLMRSMPSWS